MRAVLLALVVAAPVSYVWAKVFQLVVADWILERWETPTLPAILVTAAYVGFLLVFGGLAVVGAWALAGLP